MIADIIVIGLILLCLIGILSYKIKNRKTGKGCCKSDCESCRMCHANSSQEIVEETRGLVHLYHGNGKGKTTAAVGLAVRASGSEIPVLFVQFLKDGTSSEIVRLRAMQGITVLCVAENFGFYEHMGEDKREEAKRCYTSLWKKTLQICRDGKRRVLILDESMAACRYGFIQEEELLTFLKEKPKALEVVMTGREPSERICELSDYITEMKKQKHPYEQLGIKARKGIEY